MKVKQNDMIEVLVKEILDLNNELVYRSQDSMKKLERLQTRIGNNGNKDNNDMIRVNAFKEYNGFLTRFLKKNDRKIKHIRHRLNIFNKIFEIITEEGDK